MKLTCYGTGAAEAIPAIYCSCAVCENARLKKGAEVRTRHSSVVDGDIQFDCGPDHLHHILALGLEPRAIRHLLITHAHADHYAPEEVRLRKPPFCLRADDSVMQLIGCEQVLRALQIAPAAYAEYRLKVTLGAAYQPIMLDGDTCVTPLPANHAPDSGGGFLYLLERGGKKLLYAHDTGLFFDEVVQWLCGKSINAISLDCTGAYNGAGVHHLDIAGCEVVLKRLESGGALKPGALCVINHFSHGGGATHKQLVHEAEKRGWVAAYDGMTVDF